MQHWDFRPNILFVFFPPRISATPNHFGTQHRSNTLAEATVSVEAALCESTGEDPVPDARGDLGLEIGWFGWFGWGKPRFCPWEKWLFHHEIGSGLALGSLFLPVCLCQECCRGFPVSDSWQLGRPVGHRCNMVWFYDPTPEVLKHFACINLFLTFICIDYCIDLFFGRQRLVNLTNTRLN